MSDGSPAPECDGSDRLLTSLEEANDFEQEDQAKDGDFPARSDGASNERISETACEDAEVDTTTSFIKEGGEAERQDDAQDNARQEGGEKAGHQEEEIQQEDANLVHPTAKNADDRARSKIQRMERRNHQRSPPRTKSAPAVSAVVVRTASTSTADGRTRHPCASCEPGGGLAIATVNRPEPEPAFKAASAPTREAPQVGAVFCSHRPDPETQQSLGGSQAQQSSGKSAWSAALTSNTPRATANMHIDNTPTNTEWFKESALQQEEDLQDQIDVTTSSTGHDSVQPMITSIAAEVVPETQLDLERAISDRVRRDLFLSASLRQEILKDAPIAVIVEQSMNPGQSPERIDEEEEVESTLRASIHSGMGVSSLHGGEKRPQWILGLLLLMFLIVITVVIVVITLVATGAFSSSNRDFSEATHGVHQDYEDDFVLATVPETICYDRLPYMGFSVDGVIPACRPQPLGSPVTNLLQQSRLWNFPKAEIAIGSAGEIKRDIMSGNFTYANLKTFMPYNDTLFFVTLHGSQIVSLLERVLQTIVNDLALSSLSEDTLDGAYPYAAGLRYRVNLSEAFPQRISNVEVTHRLNESWRSLNLTEQYTVVTSMYLKNGGDGYHELSTVASESTSVSSRAAFIEYCLSQRVLLTPPRESFSTQSFYFVPGMYNSWNF